MSNDERYTVTAGDRLGYMHHVVDSKDDRVIASCTAGSHEENREDAERIAELLNGAVLLPVDDLMRDCAAHQRRLEAWRREVSEILGLVPPETEGSDPASEPHHA